MAVGLLIAGRRAMVSKCPMELLSRLLPAKRSPFTGNSYPQEFRFRMMLAAYVRNGCVYRIFDSAWTQGADGVSLQPDD